MGWTVLKMLFVVVGCGCASYLAATMFRDHERFKETLTRWQLKVQLGGISFCGIGVLAIACYLAATEVLPAYPKFEVLRWLFAPVAVGYMICYATVFNTRLIYEVLKTRKPVREKIMQPIMYYPTVMRVWSMSLGLTIATAGIGTMLMLEFLN